MARKPRRKNPSKAAAKERQKVSEQHYLDKSKGILISYKVEVDEYGEVIRYALAYIDPTICAKDNGRALGYDNNHDYHHRHYFGEMTAIEFKGYSELLKLFEQEFWELYHEHHD